MADEAPERRFPWSALLKWLFAVAVVAFGVAYFVENAAKLGDALASANLALIAVAVPLVVIALAFSFDSWWILWRAFDRELPLAAAIRVYFTTQLGKYVPGSIWPIAAQAAVARRYGLRAGESVLLSLIAMAVSIAVGLSWGLALTLIANPAIVGGHWWLAFVAILGVLLVLPPVVRAVSRLAGRIPRVDASRLDYTGAIALRSGGGQWVNWIFGGLQLWVIVVALGADPAAALLPALGAFPLAFTLGILLIPFPAGLGVREVVIAVALAGVIDQPTAALAAVISRLVYAGSDFLLAGVALLVGRRAGEAGTSPTGAFGSSEAG